MSLTTTFLPSPCASPVPAWFGALRKRPESANPPVAQNRTGTFQAVRGLAAGSSQRGLGVCKHDVKGTLQLPPPTERPESNLLEMSLPGARLQDLGNLVEGKVDLLFAVVEVGRKPDARLGTVVDQDIACQ